MTQTQHDALAQRVLARTASTDDAVSPAQDRLERAEAIARFLGITTRQARWRMDRGMIPHGREGERFVASRRALSEHWRRITSGEGA